MENGGVHYKGWMTPLLEHLAILDFTAQGTSKIMSIIYVFPPRNLKIKQGQTKQNKLSINN